MTEEKQEQLINLYGSNINKLPLKKIKEILWGKFGEHMDGYYFSIAFNYIYIRRSDHSGVSGSTIVVNRFGIYHFPAGVNTEVKRFLPLDIKRRLIWDKDVKNPPYEYRSNDGYR